jgi:hypothetical protein
MGTRRQIILIASLAVLFLLKWDEISVGVSAMSLPQGLGRTVLDGAYTEEQAAAGGTEFAANCARCHEGVCPDGPPLVGPLFIERWREDNLGSLFKWVRTRMPRNAGGSLSEKVYLNAIAFLLQENGYPSGAVELSASNAGEIQFIGKAGPKPLPGNAVVEVVGCLSKAPSGDWQLTNGSDPVRYRYGTDATPDELKTAAATPPGKSTFELTNVEESGANSQSMTGHRVQIRGPLLRQRIHVTSMESVAAACTP